MNRGDAERNLLPPVVFNIGGFHFKGQSKLIPCGKAIHEGVTEEYPLNGQRPCYTSSWPHLPTPSPSYLHRVCILDEPALVKLKEFLAEKGGGNNTSQMLQKYIAKARDDSPVLFLHWQNGPTQEVKPVSCSLFSCEFMKGEKTIFPTINSGRWLKCLGATVSQDLTTSIYLHQHKCATRERAPKIKGKYSHSW